MRKRVGREGGAGEGRASTTLDCAKRVEGKADLARKGITCMASMISESPFHACLSKAQ